MWQYGVFLEKHIRKHLWFHMGDFVAFCHGSRNLLSRTLWDLHFNLKKSDDDSVDPLQIVSALVDLPDILLGQSVCKNVIDCVRSLGWILYFWPDIVGWFSKHSVIKSISYYFKCTVRTTLPMCFVSISTWKHFIS